MTHPPIENVLQRLANVRETRGRKWSACCPAHQDRSPSLSVEERSDGAVLVHCFAGCTTLEIVRAIGLEMKDLFPPKALSFLARSKYPKSEMSVRDAAALLAFESDVLLVVAADLKTGHALSPQSHESLIKAGAAIARAKGALSNA